MYAHEQKLRDLRARAADAKAGVRYSIESPRSSAEESRESTHKSGSLKSAARKVVNAVKQHHQNTNKAFDAYYGTSYYAQNTGMRGSVKHSA